MRIGDDVEIGANTCIDRGALGDTVIGDGVKLDNLIQIGHNVRIGAHTAIAGCVGIAGSARIGAHCMIGGGAGIIGHLTIADHVIIVGATPWSRARSPSRASTAAVPVRRQCRRGRRTPPRCATCTRCATGCEALEKKTAMTMDIHEILKKLPHRYPFLLVDRVLELEHGKRIKALKNVTINEPYFLGHFPHRPVMPGVLMLEALAQAAALLVVRRRGREGRRQHRLLLRRHRRARASSARSSRATS